MATSSNSYKVWLPGTTPGTEYSYYILATNSANGTTTVSERQTVTTSAGVQIGMSNAKVESSTEAIISYAAQDFATAAVEYAQVGPGITTIQWQRAQHTYKDQEQKFTLPGLQPNSEYVYRIVSSEDNTWAGSTKSDFKWFATKLENASVDFVGLEDKQGIPSLSTVTVRASDVNHDRFANKGILCARLLIDDEDIVAAYTRTTGADYADFTFDLSGLSFNDGVHEIEAVAYDDYWRMSFQRIRVMLDDGSSTQSRVLTSASLSTSSTSESSNSVPKLNRQVQGMQRTIRLCYLNHTWGSGTPQWGHAWIQTSDGQNYGFYGRRKYMGKKAGTLKAWPTDINYYYCATYLPARVMDDKESWQKLQHLGVTNQQSFRVMVTDRQEKDTKTRISNDISALTKHPLGRPFYTFNGHYVEAVMDVTAVTGASYDLGEGFNCATWLGRIIPSDYRIDFRPWNIGNFATYLNAKYKRKLQ